MVCSYEEIIGPSCLLHRGKSTTPDELVRIAVRLTGKSSIAALTLGSLVTCDSKALEMLGWRPPVTMDTELQGVTFHDSNI